MDRRLLIALIAVLLALSVTLSGCAGTSRIASFFQNNEYQSHAKLIDFMIFFVLFFAMSYLGFSKWFGEGFGKPGGAKGAVIGLSFALSLMLTFALVTQTQFSITTLFPLAKAVLFLVFCLLMYGLLNQIIQSDSKTGKIVTFILACILVYLLMTIFTHFVCQLSDNLNDPACSSDFFNAFSKLGYSNLWGPGTLFGGSYGTSSAGSQFWTTGTTTPGTTGTGTPGTGPPPEDGESPTPPGPGTTPEGPSRDQGIGWGHLFWIIPLLLVIGVLIWLFIRRRRLVVQQNQRIRALMEELRRLIQSRATVMNQLVQNNNQYNITPDYNALTALLNGMQTQPGVRQQPAPQRAPIENFFNQRTNTGQLQHFIPLQGRQRQEMIDNLFREKQIQWELGRLLHWYRQIFTNRLEQINEQDIAQQDLVFSPKFHANGSLELMFDARNINGFEPNVRPSIDFAGAPPPGNPNQEAMNPHVRLPNVFIYPCGILNGGVQFDYGYWFRVQGVPAPQYTRDMLNPVRTPGAPSSRVVVDFQTYDIT